jgi:hypothetical protein
MNELRLQNLEVKTNTIIADCINLTNKVDILIQNSNRSIFNELNAFFANLITNLNYIMVGSGVLVLGIGAFMYLRGSRGNYVQVSPLLTERSQLLTQQTMSLIAQSQALSSATLHQQIEREPKRSLGNMILQILEEWLEGMKERRQHGRKDFK